MQTLALGRRHAISDRDRDQGMGDAVAIGIQEAGGGQRVARRPELVERDRRNLGDCVRRSAVADHGARLRDRSVARLELGQAPAHDGARGRADVRPVRLDLMRQLAEQPRVAAGRAVALGAHPDWCRSGASANQPGGAHRGERLGMEHGRRACTAEQGEQVRRARADRRSGRPPRSTAGDPRSARRGR